MTRSTDLFLEYRKTRCKPALSELLRSHQDAVYSVCQHVLRHPQDAEDACQEVLLEVSRQVDAIEEPGSFAGWLYRTALHTALDFRRRRSRRRAREAAARRPGESRTPPESTEALYQSLASLDDASRRLVVEYYFGRRTLRELAADEGCSEVAVWKRIQSSRERLRKELGSVAVLSLEGIGMLRAPAGLFRKVLPMKGGAIMMISGATKLAIAIPVALVAGALLVGAFRPSGASARGVAPSALPKAQPPIAKGVPPPSAPPLLRSLPTPVAAVEARPALLRKPYPFDTSARAPSNAVGLAWKKLATRRITLDVEDLPAGELLQVIARTVELVIHADPDFDASGRVSFKAVDIGVDGALRLLLGPRSADFELQSDGTIHVGPQEKISGGFEREARTLEAPLQQLAFARWSMDQGWDGVRDQLDFSAQEAVLRAKRLVVSQGQSTLEEEIRRLEESAGVTVWLDPEPPAPEIRLPGQSVPAATFLQVVEEHSVGQHLDFLAKQNGRVAVAVDENSFRLMTPEKAAQYQASRQEEKRTYEGLLQSLGKGLEESGSYSVQSFFESIQASPGIPVVPSEEAWESSARVTLPAGSTVRQGLDAFKAEGYRWALSGGKVFIFK
jgi:RNA polymerase sigma-70 factor (ECF subfamily)